MRQGHHRAADKKLRQFSKHMRHNPTDAEAVLWSKLRNRRLSGLKFRRQESISPYIVDFVCFEKRLIIEVDGGHHADNPYDKKRDRFLTKSGFTVIRFWNSDVLNTLDDVCMHLLKSAGKAEPEQ